MTNADEGVMRVKLCSLTRYLQHNYAATIVPCIRLIDTKRNGFGPRSCLIAHRRAQLVNQK